MASPQTENGFTRIANELIEAVCRLKISGAELRILLYIIRRTYGFGCISAEITRSSIADAVCMNEVNVSRVIRKLRDGGIIYQQFIGRNGRQVLGIQKDYCKWSFMPDNEDKTLPPIDENVNESKELEADDNAKPIDETHNEKHKNMMHTDKKMNKKECMSHYGRYGNVALTKEEYDGILRDYGASVTADYIQRVDTHSQAHNKRYARYEPIIRQWLENDNVKKAAEDDIEKYNFVINKF